MDKVWYKSKTFWVNLIGTLIAALTSADVMPLIPKDRLATVLGIVAILNIVLRTMKTSTQGGLTLTAPDPNRVTPTGRTGTDG